MQYGEDHGKIRWRPLTTHVLDAVRKAYPSSPAFDEKEPARFQTHWRNVFEQMRKDISADDSIDKYLTDPPVEKANVLLFDTLHSLGCCCCHPDNEPNIVLEREGGITKEDFVDGLAAYLYGSGLPKVYIEPEPYMDDAGEASRAAEAEDEDEDEGEDFTNNEGVLIYDCGWISQGGGQTYQKHPNIFMYCYGGNKFEDYQLERKNSDASAVAVEDSRVD
ncbi:uncharacterized protein F5Z01DRAFT_156178 [Emericellopsis atlantica]|uniref:Uncharacterized protein n=1 Tax=Emericellopsis atlantica TaxID=2614577 RepID=A0A9P7ZJF0_9HYPO|nr:uncharacterized protein F5Z01DRAFT_156178 [Emericellopsis atlantica]KAG9253194.1 hypothetical protein F5Z01DRAFT_156178 [Emericellopsis atlantica]